MEYAGHLADLSRFGKIRTREKGCLNPAGSPTRQAEGTGYARQLVVRERMARQPSVSFMLTKENRNTLNTSEGVAHPV